MLSSRWHAAVCRSLQQFQAIPRTVLSAISGLGSMARKSRMAASIVEPLLRSRAVAELLAVSIKTVYAWQRDGVLPGVRLGRARRTIRYRRADVERLLQRAKQAPAAGQVVPR